MTVPFVSCECFLTVVIVLTDLWVNATTHATHASTHTAPTEHVVGVYKISAGVVPFTFLWVAQSLVCFLDLLEPVCSIRVVRVLV